MSDSSHVVFRNDTDDQPYWIVEVKSRDVAVRLTQLLNIHCMGDSNYYHCTREVWDTYREGDSDKLQRLRSYSEPRPIRAHIGAPTDARKGAE